MNRAMLMLASSVVLLGSAGQARAEFLVTFQFTGHVTQSDFSNIPLNTTYTGLFSYFTAGNGWASAPASPTTPITMTLNSGPLSFSEVFTQPPNQQSSGGGVFLLGGPPPTIIQAEASIRDASGNLQDFWLVSFTDNSGTAFTKPPPASFDLSLFPQGGGLLFINEANPNLPSFSGPIDSLVGTAVATPEPSTLTLLGLGSLGLLGYGGRRWKRAVA